MLMLPQNLVERLGLGNLPDRHRLLRGRAQGGTPGRRPPVTVKIGDRITQTQCVVGPPLSEVLIGQLVLNAMDMVADCTNRTLKPRTPGHPVLKMK